MVFSLTEQGARGAMTLGYGTSQAHYVVAPRGATMYLLQLDSWAEPFPRHWHEEWAVAVIQQGINRFWYRRAWHNAGPGTIVVVPPGEVHDGGLARDAVWGERMFYIPVESMARVVEAYTGSRKEPCFSGPIIHDKSLTRMLRRLHRTFTSGEGTLDPLEASECQISCLGPLVERYGHMPIAERRDVGPARIKRTVELLHDDPMLKLTIDELAVQVGLSPFHLIRAFRKHVGLTPHAYLKQLRIARAQSLLRGGLSIAEVALAAGFSDQSHLTREFRRSLALTPGRYTEAQLGARVARTGAHVTI
jgi:AraC-like DNA-binding protein